jgi:hypothetical protein
MRQSTPYASSYRDEFDVELSNDSECTYVIPLDRRRRYPGTGVEWPDVYGSRASISHNILKNYQPSTSRAPAHYARTLGLFVPVSGRILTEDFSSNKY